MLEEQRLPVEASLSSLVDDDRVMQSKDALVAAEVITLLPPTC